MHEQYKKLSLKNVALKKKILSLTKELKDFSKEKKNKLTYDMCANLKVGKGGLYKEIDDLLKIVYKFTNEKKNFDMMLGKQRGMFDKGGIG